MSFETSKFEKIPLKKETEINEEILKLYKGVWAENLKDGQLLPVEGKLFGNEMTLELNLDFKMFEAKLNGCTIESISNLYTENEKRITGRLKEYNSDIDPRLYYLCYLTQQKVHELLEVDPESSIDPQKKRKREKMYIDSIYIYKKESPLKLSELKEISGCVERTALGQYLLQKLKVKSAYVEGVTMKDARDVNESPTRHSFIVLLRNEDKNLIFDITNPLPTTTGKYMPRIYKPDVNFTSELLSGKKELLIGAIGALINERKWFGVGEIVPGKKEILERKEP